MTIMKIKNPVLRWLTKLEATISNFMQTAIVRAGIF